MQRCGFVAILGEANAGKSTFVNAAVGEKVSIVSSKPHTTRYSIYGILGHQESQIIFIDTPGVISRPQNPLQHLMSRVTSRSAGEAEAALLIVDAAYPNYETTAALAQRVKGIPLFLAFNKVDLLDKAKLLPLIQHYQELTPEIFLISAKKKRGLDAVIDKLAQVVPEGPWLFPPEDLTQVPQRVWAAEMTREKVFECVHEEIPYSTHVVTDHWDEDEASVTLHQTIFVTKPKYRQLVLGHQGKRIKLIGQKSRFQMEDCLRKKVNLFLYVKLDPHWVRQLDPSFPGV